ncbi:MAG: response regulator [[Clostridium] scindens]
MDIRMPLMDGLAATTNIRHLSNEDARKIPIIAMTANAFDDDIEKSKAAGMNAHLAKPIEPEQLYQVMYRFYIWRWTGRMRTFKEIFEEYGQIIRKRLPVSWGMKMYMKFLGMLFQDPSMEKLGQALKDKDYGGGIYGGPYVKRGYREYGANASIDRVCAIVEPLRLGEARRLSGYVPGDRRRIP